MHDVLIAQWIPQLVAQHQQFILEHKHDTNTPVVWHLSDKKEPYFTQDLLRERRIQTDQEQNQRFPHAITNLLIHEGYRVARAPKRILKNLS